MKSFVIAALFAVSSAEIITIDTDDFQAASPAEALFFNEDPEVDGAEPTTPCCNSCTEPLEKYHRVVFYQHPFPFDNCSEACMLPSKFWIYKYLFGIEKSTTNTPCADREYTEYENTKTYGYRFWNTTLTLDLYGKKKDEDAEVETLF